MSEHNLDVVMLSETRCTSYYSYSSEGHLVILSGNQRDKFAGVGAVVHPRIRPHLSDVYSLLIESFTSPLTRKEVEFMS